MNVVRLEPPELCNAGIVGVMRRVSAIQRSRPAAYGNDGVNAWSLDIDAAAAEMAVAKYLGFYWKPLAAGGVRSSIRGDAGSYVQVRSTSRPDGSLIVHERDSSSEIFYLVLCAAPEYTIAGWVLGHEAKQTEFWRDDVRHPAFFVPQHFLHECNEGAELPEWIRWVNR